MIDMIDKARFDKLIAIWDKDGQYVPLVPLKLIPDCLLFVGLNPSFNSNAIKSTLKKIDTDIYSQATDVLRIDPTRYFLWTNRSKFCPELDAEIHRSAKENYPYFSKFKQLSEMLGIKWDHTDLFFERETSQKEFRSNIFKDPQDTLNTFYSAQLKIACEMITESKPKCIVVANALASDIYKSHYKLEFIKNSGCYIQKIKGQDIPVFLSSMLTGQRALDKYSFERLAWHIGKVLNLNVTYNV